MGSKVNNHQHKEGKAILCMLKTNVHDHTIYKIRMNELRTLVNALNIEIIDEIIQSRYKPFSKYLFGSGKVKELQRKTKRQKVDLVIFYNILRSSQKLNLIRALKVEVIDRFELTLEIFDRMASDKLSKLQIQSARLGKQIPFYKLQASINYTHDRPFFRSGGEYGFHGQLREITKNQARIREEINNLMNEKLQRIDKRKKLEYPIICIAGFYNAGKTSLFNVLTGDTKPVSNRPFTTLTSKYQKRFIDYKTTVLFIDTIGFVLDLDPRLIQSFKLNLLDIKSADLVILLLEITDPILTLQLKISEGIKLLKEIGVNHEKIIIVFNKLDKNPDLELQIGEKIEIERYEVPWISISAKTKTNIESMLELISERLNVIKKTDINKKNIPPLKRAETSINRLLMNYQVPNISQNQDPFKSLVRSILSQNTNSKNSQAAYNNLEKIIGITLENIRKASMKEIIEAIHPAGMYNIRSKTIKSISNEILTKFNGNIQEIFNKPFPIAREELMSLPGVGPKTADVTLMFSSDYPVIPVDRHIMRISKRWEIIPQNSNYEKIRKMLEDASNPNRYKDIHLSLIKFGQEICRAKKPKCTDCFLNDICPFP
jgi:GTP-binding protein HflX